MKYTTFALVAVLGLFTMMPAMAGEGDKPCDKEGKCAHKGKKGKMMHKKLVEKFDKDGDGELSKDEHKAMHEARKAEMMKKFDKDGDGELSAEEKKALHEHMKENHPHAHRRHMMKKKFDKDGDGKLSEAEREAAKEAMKGMKDKRQAKRGEKDGVEAP